MVNDRPSAAASYALDFAKELLAPLRVAVITGAGVSTESGIPDYRGMGINREESPSWSEFASSAPRRERFWRSCDASWGLIQRAIPNQAHMALARLQNGGRVTAILTQNVDGLHQQAGSDSVIELHGSLWKVRCASCQTETATDTFLKSFRQRPSGDCQACGGIIRPNTVMFGENLADSTMEIAYAAVTEAEALPVIGSSLAVNTGMALVSRASSLGRPVVIVNLGSSQGSKIADVTINVTATEGVKYIYD